ncbi:MAG TPA: phosphate ABC transporter substrate-binding protein [Thermodesulfobacteriota bacterium]|nr:phosphate ABC transporter substrate-binding protein [Thermodesulfobacteriota bacterium]
MAKQSGRNRESWNNGAVERWVKKSKKDFNIPSLQYSLRNTLISMFTKSITRLWIIALLICLPLTIGCQRSKAGITVAGSTSVEPFAELLAEEYMSQHRESHIYVQGGGSTAGIEAAITRAANIGMSSRSLIDNEKRLYAVTIARDAIAIIVHPMNPIGNLSLDQVRDVFSGKVENWKELGGPTHPIDIVTREEGSGTRESFQNFVMGKEDISLGALVQDSNGAVRQVISNDSSAIGYISLGLVNDQVKAIKISGVEPNLSNVDDGKYKLVRPFLFVFNGEPAGEAKSFLDFVLSRPAQKLLLKEGLVPVIQKP